MASDENMLKVSQNCHTLVVLFFNRSNVLVIFVEDHPDPFRSNDFEF